MKKYWGRFDVSSNLIVVRNEIFSGRNENYFRNILVIASFRTTQLVESVFVVNIATHLEIVDSNKISSVIGIVHFVSVVIGEHSPYLSVPITTE